MTDKNMFKQVCVWPATLVPEDQVVAFEEFMQENLHARVKFLEVIHTYPDIKNGTIVEGTGGRSDVFFAVHSDDIGKFALARLPYGIRWIEDVFGNGNESLYPERVSDYRTW